MPSGGFTVNIYCLFCETDKVRYISCYLRDLYACTVVIPKQIQHTWSGGRMTDTERDLLPGYLFLYSEEPLDGTLLCRVQSVIRCLRTTDGKFELQGADEEFARMLLSRNGIIGKTPVYQVGQKIRIRDGAFAGLQTSILRVDRRAGRMQIEIPFANQKIRTWVEYDVIQAEDDPSA